MQDNIDIVIVDPNEINGEGLRRILTENDFRIVGRYQNVAQIGTAREEAGRITIGIVTAPADAGALEICIDLHGRRPDLKILVMGHSCRSQQVADAFRGGADGYVNRDISCAGLVETLRLVALGEKMVPSQVVFDLVAPRSDGGWTRADTRIEDAHVSEREIEILQGLIAGEPNKVISRRLGITEATVKVHVKSILRKLNVMNRTQAAIWAVSRGLEAQDGCPPPFVDGTGPMARVPHMAVAMPAPRIRFGAPALPGGYDGHGPRHGNGRGDA